MYSINTKYTSKFRRHFLLNFYLKVYKISYGNYAKLHQISYRKQYEISRNKNHFRTKIKLSRIPKNTLGDTPFSIGFT